MTGSFDTHARQEMLSLLFALREGTLAQTDAARLEAIVLEHGEARQIYVEWVNMWAALHRRFSSDAATAVVGPSAAEEQVDLPHRVWQSIRTVASNYMALSLLVSAIVMANLLLAMALIMPGDHAQVAVDDVPSLRDAVAAITNTSDASWGAASDGNFRERTLLLGDRLVLNSGIAEITFATGARVSLEGPAEFTIGSGKLPASKVHQRNAGYLERGALLATCETPNAHGFAIATPQAIVVDLGTVFAVAVDANDNFTAEVIEGEVELHQDNKPIKLAAGRTAVISSEGVLTLESVEPQDQQKRFARFELAPPLKTKQVVNVDFGADPSARYVGLAAAADLRTNTYWNAFGRGQRQADSLLASDGKTLTRIGFVSGAGEAGQLPGQQRVALLDDYQFHWATNGSFTLTLSGLSPKSTYDIYLYASSAHNQGSVFTIGELSKATKGTMIDHLAPGINFVHFAAVAPNAEGKIVVTVAENEQSAAMLNGFQIVELEPTKQ